MECQLSVIPQRSVDQSDLCSRKSIHTVNRTWQGQAQHIIHDNSPSQRREHIWQLLLMAVIFMWCLAVMFQSGIHLPGLSRTDADNTRPTCKHLIPQSYVRAKAVLAKCWQRQRHYSCIFFIVVVFQRELILKAIFLLREQIVHRKLYLPSLGDDWLHLLVFFAAKNWKDFICGEARRKKQERSGAY